MPNRITTIAARNVRPGDTFIMKIGAGPTLRVHEHRVLRVERLDFEDRIMVAFTMLDNSTWVASERTLSFKLYHTVQVRKGSEPRTFMSWEPVYSDKTNKRNPVSGKC